MTKNIKLLSTLFIATMYLAGLFFAFSGDLMQQIQTVRHQNQIEKTSRIETISLSLSQWNAVGDKQEVKLNGVYYDVVSQLVSGQKVTLKAVKDGFENEVRVAFSQVFKKNKSPNSDKKKTNISLHQIAFEPKTNGFQKNAFNSIVTENFKSNFDLKTNSFIYSPQKPPCV